MDRPADDDLVPIVEAIQGQQEYARERGSPVMSLMLAAAAEDIGRGGLLGSLLPETVRFGDFVPLRLTGTLHRLALERRIPEVAIHLPTLGGTPPSTPSGRRAFGDAVISAAVEHAEEVRSGLASVPQTNEPGRAVALRAALSRVVGDVHLRELGASAGLHLRADHLPGMSELEAGPMPTVVSRVGCDRSPIDPTTTNGRLLLSSYVWVDDVDRFARLGRALDVAARVPATVRRAEIADFAEGLALVPGAILVVWHSAVWPYLDADTRSRVEAALSRLGAQVTASTGLVDASWEWEDGPVRSEFVLTMRRWTADGPTVAVLARGPSHGGPEVHPA